MPFASHQSTEKKAAPAASNRVAHLNRLLEINPEPLVSHTDASWRSSADSRAPEKPAEPTRSHREHLKLEAESVEMRLQIKRQQVQLETARILMQLALPLEQRLQSALKHWVQSFDFWGARLQLTDLGHPLHQYPCDLEWVSTRLKNWKYQRLGTKQRLHHQAYPDYQELMISLQKQNQSYGQLSLAYSPAQTLSAESEQDLKVLADDMSQFLEDLAAYQWTRSAQMEDPLTGLPNHTGFQLAFEAMIDTRSQKKLPMACFMLDLDFLTQINEVHGYEQGDLVLQHLTQILMKHLPDNAILGRLGNDRFGVVLSQLS